MLAASSCLSVLSLSGLDEWCTAHSSSWKSPKSLEAAAIQEHQGFPSRGCSALTELCLQALTSGVPQVDTIPVLKTRAESLSLLEHLSWSHSEDMATSINGKKYYCVDCVIVCLENK